MIIPLIYIHEHRGLLRNQA